jgi:two-component system, OmpR family, phosphate regulon sensor histidine kinase PhoR
VAWAPLLTNTAGISLDPESHDLSRILLLPLVLLALAVIIRLLVNDLQAKDVKVRTLLEGTGRSGRLLSTVMDAVGVGVLAVDGEGREILSNRQMQYFDRLACSAAADPAGEDRLLFDIDGTTPLPAHRWPSQRAHRGELFSEQLLRIGSHPNQRMLSSSVRYLKNDEGTSDGAVIAFTDVTDLLTALHARDDLIANVSHELKTPLTVILGNAEMLLDDEPEPRHRSGLEAIERNSMHLLGLVEDLLNTAKKTGIRPVPVDVSDLLTRSAAEAGLRAEAKGISIRIDIPPASGPSATRAHPPGPGQPTLQRHQVLPRGQHRHPARRSRRRHPELPGH